MYFRRGENRAGAGEPNIDKPASLTRPFPRRGASARRALRMALHAQARQLARHGRIRTRRSRVAMSGSPHRRQANPRPRSHRMAGPPQQAPRQSRLAIHNRQRPRQAEETVPSVRVTCATSMRIPKRIPKGKLCRGHRPDMVRYLGREHNRSTLINLFQRKRARTPPSQSIFPPEQRQIISVGFLRLANVRSRA